MTRLIPILLATICLAACKKDKNDNNDQPTLVGKWMQTATFSKGGSACNCWIPITDDIGAFKLEFKSDGSFTMTPPMYYSAAYCPGDYSVESDSLVWTNGICGPDPRPILKSYFEMENNKTLLIKYHHVPNYYYEMKFKRVSRF